MGSVGEMVNNRVMKIQYELTPPSGWPLSFIYHVVQWRLNIWLTIFTSVLVRRYNRRGSVSLSFWPSVVSIPRSHLHLPFTHEKSSCRETFGHARNLLRPSLSNFPSPLSVLISAPNKLISIAVTLPKPYTFIRFFPDWSMTHKCVPI